MSTNRYERSKERTRQRLLDAAIALVLEKGYEVLTITEIADRADCGRGTFYLHYKDKEDLVWAAIEHYFQMTNKLANESTAGLTSPQREYLSWKLTFESAQRTAPFFVQLGEKAAPLFLSRMKTYLRTLYDQNLHEERYHTRLDLPIPFMATFIAGAVMDVITWWAETGFIYTPAQMADMLYQMVFREPPPK